MTTNQRLFPYRDLTSYYPTPATDQLASAGWWRQAANNYSTMANAAQIRGGQDFGVGWVSFVPDWSGVTLTTGLAAASAGGYVQVGQIVYVWARATIDDLSAEPAALASLPVAPSDSVLPMHAGYGYVFDGTLDRAPFAAELDPATGGLAFYWSTTSTSGQIVDGDPLTIDVGDTGVPGEIGVYATYRVDPPAGGTLNGFGYVIDAQEVLE